MKCYIWFKIRLMRILPFIFVLGLVACSSNPAVQAVTPKDLSPMTDPVETTKTIAGWLTNRSDRFTIDHKSQVLVTTKRSRIHVPENAFERKDGKLPTGKVTLIFKEYQTAGEILASGLPMTYTDSKGKTIDFESAGMFEIRAMQGTDSLVLRKGKEIEVELASPSKGKYNFYGLSDNTRSWTEKAKNLSPVPNPYLQAATDSLKRLDAFLTENEPKRMVAYSPGDQLFDIKVNPVNYPEFQEIGGVMWKYAGTDKKEDPAMHPAYFNANYSFTRLFPVKGHELIYTVEFASEKDTLQLKMAPVFSGKLREKGERKLREKLERFNAALVKQEQIRVQQRGEQKLLRIFKVDQLGIYNYDRQYKTTNIPVFAQFKLGDQPFSEIAGAAVYLIPEGKLCVVKYTAETEKLFAINPYERNQLIAILGEDQVYALSDQELRAMNLPAFHSKALTIQLRKLNTTVKTGAEMDAVLAKL